MKRIRAILIIAALLLSSPLAVAGDPPGVDPLIPGRAIIRTPVGSRVSNFLGVLNANFPTINASVIDSLPSRNYYLLQFTPLPTHQQTDALEFALNVTYPNQGLLVLGELMYEGKAPEGSTGSVWVDGPATFSIFDTQYIRTKTRLPDAHARSSGASTVIAVLDTGIDGTHPVLAGRMASGGHNYIANTTNTADAGDGVDNDADNATDELVGHGTFVAGLIAMAAPGAKILPITVLNSDGKGDNWSLTKGMYHAIDRGVEVINLSLTSTYDSVAVIASINEAAARGIVVVAAAGNMNRDDPREYPAMDDDIPVLGVAATDDNDVKGGFSNFNNRLFISAPGVNARLGGVPISTRSVASALPGGVFGYSEGTSMATPLVTAAAALIRAQHPEWPASPQVVTTIRQRLASTAQNINAVNPGLSGELGAGRVDIGAAVALGPIAPRPGDLNNDGLVNTDDLLRVVIEWGTVHTAADINGSGRVDTDDLITLIVNWG